MIPSRTTDKKTAPNTTYQYKKAAPIKTYIQNITKRKEEITTLEEIINIFKAVIRTEKLYDHRNPAVIICSEAMATALNTRTIHMTEIRSTILKQLEPKEKQTEERNQDRSKKRDSNECRNLEKQTKKQRQHKMTQNMIRDMIKIMTTDEVDEHERKKQ